MSNREEGREEEGVSMSGCQGKGGAGRAVVYNQGPNSGIIQLVWFGGLDSTSLVPGSHILVQVSGSGLEKRTWT